MKKVADSSDSDEPEEKDDKPRSKKNKVGYNLLLFCQVTDFLNRRRMRFQSTTIHQIPSLTTLSLPLMNVNSSRRLNNKDSKLQVEK